MLIKFLSVGVLKDEFRLFHLLGREGGVQADDVQIVLERKIESIVQI